MATAVRSFSKINLGLRIGPVRADGFHGLRTMYQTLALHDIVTVSAAKSNQTRISIASNHPGVPTDDRNTAWRIVAEALTGLGILATVNIHIQKELPVQGGMGAGSANAAAALLALERELGIALAPSDRLILAASIGSDVPLFLVGGTSIGLDRGQEVIPYPDLPRTPCVIAVPTTGVSTPAAFREWDRIAAEAERSTFSAPDSLTQLSGSDRLEELGRIYASVFSPTGDASIGATGVSWAGSDKSNAEQAGDLAGNALLALVRTGIENDFEEVVFRLNPPLRAIKQALLGHENGSLSAAQAIDSKSSAIFAGLSGSGSALFGLYHSVADAEAARQRVEAQGVRAIVTSTLPRSEYWKTMFL